MRTYDSSRKTDIILRMGFPEWTLWGMGLSAIGALLALTLALIGLSPGFMKKSRLGSLHLDRRVRAFTSFAFALLLLAVGFFFAGVPLGTSQPTGSVANQITPIPSDLSDSALQPEGESTSSIEPTPTILITKTPATPVTGAFVGPPPTEQTQPEATAGDTTSSESADTPETDPTEPNSTPTQTDTPPPTETNVPTRTPTPTVMPTPTVTPEPTLTPTPITGETAVVNTQGSTIWLQRSPGGQELLLVKDQDLVILNRGHANQGGILWQEVTAVNGVVGWIPEEFLLPEAG
jgi:hypothetical protein